MLILSLSYRTNSTGIFIVTDLFILHPNKLSIPPIALQTHTQTQHTHTPPQVLTIGCNEKRRVFALGHPEPPSLFPVLKVHCAPLDSSESHAGPAALGACQKGRHQQPVRTQGHTGRDAAIVHTRAHSAKHTTLLHMTAQ